MLLKWFHWEELTFVLTLNDEEEEKFKTSAGLFRALIRFKSHHNGKILSLKYKLT